MPDPHIFVYKGPKSQTGQAAKEEFPNISFIGVQQRDNNNKSKAVKPVRIVMSWMGLALNESVNPLTNITNKGSG